MKKFKLNFKLTLYLVGLFVGFLLIFLGGKFDVCRSLGMISLGISMGLYIFFYTDIVKKNINKIDSAIEQVESGFFPIEDEIKSDDDEETEIVKEKIEDETVKTYMLEQLNAKRKKIIKNDKKVKLLFAVSGLFLVIAGFLLFI